MTFPGETTTDLALTPLLMLTITDGILDKTQSTQNMAGCDFCACPLVPGEIFFGFSETIGYSLIGWLFLRSSVIPISDTPYQIIRAAAPSPAIPGSSYHVAW